jgi:hypothetical protein
MVYKELWNPFAPPRLILIGALFLGSFSWGGDFRDNNWGDSPGDVEYYEGDTDPWIESGPYSDYKRFTSFFAYYKTHLGVHACVFFRFTPEEKLGMGFCVSDASELRSFYEWERALLDLYGEAENRDDLLTDDDSILDFFYRGGAAAVEEGILKGYFALIRYWETENSFIWLVAELSDEDLEVHVNYYAKGHFKYFRDEKKRGGAGKGFRPWFDD